MKPQAPVKSIRAGFLVVVAGSLVVLLALLGLHQFSKDKPPQPREIAEAPAALEPVAAVAPAAAPAPVAAPTPKAPPTPLEQQWGIQVSSIGLGMAGAAVDFRYKVVALDKASRLSDGTTTAYLVDQASGAKIHMIAGTQEADFATGARAHSRARMARQGGAFPPGPNRLTEGKINSVLLPNPGGLVKSGNKVTLVIGDVRTDNLVIE